MNLQDIYNQEGRGRKNYRSKYFNQRVTVNRNSNGLVVSYYLYKDGRYIDNNITNIKDLVNTEFRNDIPEVKPCPFEITIKDFDKSDIDYWNQFGIDADTAKEFGINPIESMCIHGLHSDTYIHRQYMYKMTINSGVLIKIYSPYNKEMKWLSHGTTRELCLSNMANSKHKTCCICSGMKDALSLYCQMNKSIDVFFLNSETALLSNENDAWLKNRYENIYVCYDNDETGLKQGERISSMYGYSNIVIPKVIFIFDVKDISDFYSYNSKESIEFFKSKIIVK